MKTRQSMKRKALHGNASKLERARYKSMPRAKPRVKLTLARLAVEIGRAQKRGKLAVRKYVFRTLCKPETYFFVQEIKPMFKTSDPRPISQIVEKFVKDRNSEEVKRKVSLALEDIEQAKKIVQRLAESFFSLEKHPEAAARLRHVAWSELEAIRSKLILLKGLMNRTES